MDVRVRFRFNKITGEVEEFRVDDEGTTYHAAGEHDRVHDEIAVAVGGVISYSPLVEEVEAGVPQEVAPFPDPIDPHTPNTRPERHTQG